MHALGSFFLFECTADTDLNHSKESTVLEGRKSFPSGHSSAAFAGMTFVTLWLAGKTAALCFRRVSPRSSPLSGRLAALFLTISPIFWAAFVALSRLEDNVRYLVDTLHPHDLILLSYCFSDTT
jgi:diacylglycerol diphosphate phosphatase/phosphatidate phosphatase